MVEFEFKAYRRRFSDRFSTAATSISHRSGILVKLRDRDDRVGFGEVAPIESFGTESFVSALSACTELKGKIEYNSTIESLREYPCTRFGIDSAMAAIESETYPPSPSKPWPICGLIPEIKQLDRVEELVEEGYRCLKLKIGKEPFASERACLDQIVGITGDDLKLRLDANGGLNLKEAQRWLDFIDELPIEFIEQPLPVGQEADMARLANDFATQIALDESVRSVDDLKRWKDAHWTGKFVIKPSLAGARQSLIDELRDGDREQIIFSSSLETLVGTTASLSAAIEVGAGERALGFGVESLFSDRGVSAILGPFLQPDGLASLDDMEALWNRI